MHELNICLSSATINNSIVAGYTGVNSTIPVPAVVDQVGLFLNASLSRAEPCSTLSILLAGINDGYFASSSLDVPALTDSLLNAVKQLVAKGKQSLAFCEHRAFAQMSDLLQVSGPSSCQLIKLALYCPTIRSTPAPQTVQHRNNSRKTSTATSRCPSAPRVCRATYIFIDGTSTARLPT